MGDNASSSSVLWPGAAASIWGGGGGGNGLLAKHNRNLLVSASADARFCFSRWRVKVPARCCIDRKRDTIYREGEQGVAMYVPDKNYNVRRAVLCVFPAQTLKQRRKRKVRRRSRNKLVL